MKYPRGCRSGWAKNRARLFKVVFFLKFIYATRAIDDFFAAGEKWMACAANVESDFWFVAFGHKSVAASAGNGAFNILWMYIFFHALSFRLKLRGKLYPKKSKFYLASQRSSHLVFVRRFNITLVRHLPFALPLKI